MCMYSVSPMSQHEQLGLHAVAFSAAGQDVFMTPGNAALKD